MFDRIEEFKEQYPSLASYWRSIVLFGRSTAAYKFALAESLLDIAPTGKNIVTLDELAVPFSKHLCRHMANAPKQTTSLSSQFLDACKQYNEGIISHHQLVDVTVAKGFNDVIDAFHIVNGSPISAHFYHKDYSHGRKKIILTDDIFKLQELKYVSNFVSEIDARWKLVETAWELGMPRNLLDVWFDRDARILFVNSNFKRKNVTSARDALNGYQKGKCFYCFDDIAVSKLFGDMCDVDHFFPHSLQSFFPDINFNGVWNLVLSCPNCNRGECGKFSKVPTIKYLRRLYKRNEFLISSQHPLRENIINQTGRTESERRAFLSEVDQRAINILVHRWSPAVQVAIETF